MKQFFLIVFLFITSIFYSQKKYSFDYIWLYDFQKDENSKIKKRYILTNSKENNYRLEASEKDSLNFYLHFQDEKGLVSSSQILKKDFFKAEYLTMNCNTVTPLSNKSANILQGFELKILKDTVLDSQVYKQFVFKSTDAKKAKKRKSVSFHGIVENNTSFHEPFFYLSPSRVANGENDFPKGMLKQFYLEKERTKKLECIYKLKESLQIKIFIVIPADCDYTELSKK